MAAVLLIGDDLTQYLWHRASHTPLMWPLHRAHHTAHYMSIRITYRNNFFYYLMMPGIWVSGVLVYLGFANVYLVYIVVKLTVILGAHSAVRWDEPLYRIKWLAPLAWIVERTVSTPATHWAHHALTATDGIGHYKGNFGNLLFVWDVIFGTAKITRRYPERSACPTTCSTARSAGSSRCSIRSCSHAARARRWPPAGRAYALGDDDLVASQKP